MKQLKLKQIGSFVKKHGVHGQLVLSFGENLSFRLIQKNIKEQEAVFVGMDGIPVPFFISENSLRSLNNDNAIFSLDEVDDSLAAEMIGSPVFVEESKLKTTTGKKDITIDDCIGYKVYDTVLGYIGLFNELLELRGNPLLSLDFKGEELLVPLVSDFIKDIDVDKQEIWLKLPEGYLDTLLS
ncbi:MAG: hypothetical protein U0W24_10415 [Bacteroidales bacterium]